MEARLSALPRCRPPRGLLEDVRHAGDWIKSRVASTRQCAIVGSSDMLRLDPRGAEIDKHGLVVRLNNAPTRGWEEHVGNRTSIRLINHVPIEKWVKLASNPAALASTADGDEYEDRLCAPASTSLGCIVSRMHASSTAFDRTLATYRQHYASHTIRVVSRSLHSWALQCNKEIGGTSPSGGLFAVLLALATCDAPVTLYGFWPFCCRGRHRAAAAFSADLNYKYHQGNRTRFVCCSPGRERMEAEFALYEALARHGVVKLVLAPQASVPMHALHSGTSRGGRGAPGSIMRSHVARTLAQPKRPQRSGGGGATVVARHAAPAGGGGHTLPHTARRPQSKHPFQRGPP